MVGGPPTFSTFPQCHQWFWDYAAGRIGVAEFVEWVASLSDTAEQVFVREISWAKEPGFPSHEYILLTFADISNPTHDTTLRLERDTDSWLKIFGSWLGFGSNCRDTVLIWSSSLATQHSSDRSIAHIAVTRTDIDLRHIALILQAIGQAANEYKVWSFNCWWYAGCLWRNLARWIGSNHCRFRRLRGEDQMENIAEFLAKSKQSKPVDEWDPMTFYHFQTFSHLAAVERASWDITRLKEATGYIEQLIELRVSVKFKSEFSETEGLQKTPDSSPVVDEATAESGNLDIIPSASSPPLPPHEVVHITSWGHQGSVNDITQAPAWSGPVFNDRYRIQNLSSPHPICITWLGSYLVASPRFDDQAEAILCPHPDGEYHGGGLTIGCEQGRVAVSLEGHRYYQMVVGDPICVRDPSGVGPLAEEFYFDVRETKERGVYTISPRSSPSLFWGLSGDQPDTVVRLRRDEADDRNRWRLFRLSDWSD